VVFASPDAEGDIGIENPASSGCLLAVELVLEGADQVIFRSGYIRPDYRIPRAALDVPLSPGSYRAVAYFCEIDPVSLALGDIVQQPVTLEVKG
jgi:hypothetical protein